MYVHSVQWSLYTDLSRRFIWNGEHLRHTNKEDYIYAHKEYWLGVERLETKGLSRWYSFQSYKLNGFSSLPSVSARSKSSVTSSNDNLSFMDLIIAENSLKFNSPSWLMSWAWKNSRYSEIKNYMFKEIICGVKFFDNLWIASSVLMNYQWVFFPSSRNETKSYLEVYTFFLMKIHKLILRVWPNSLLSIVLKNGS